MSRTGLLAGWICMVLCRGTWLRGGAGLVSTSPDIIRSMKDQLPGELPWQRLRVGAFLILKFLGWKGGGGVSRRLTWEMEYGGWRFSSVWMRTRDFRGLSESLFRRG